MKSKAKVVVVGGGVVGVSALYHLAKKGWSDVVLVERKELTSGSTWHAAGLLPLFNMSYSVGQLHKYAVNLYKKLEEETGKNVGFSVVSNIRLASTKDRMDEYHQYAGVAKTIGVDVKFLTPQQVKEIWPLCHTDDLVGAIQHPEDGYIQPADLTQALATGARNRGAEIYRNTTVLSMRQTKEGWIVETDKGSIECEHVISCSGNFARQTGEMVGLDIPVIPVEHQYIVTEPHPEIQKRKKEGLPEMGVLRDSDSRWYMREEAGGLILGPYEDGAPACYVEGPSKNSEYELFQEDLDRLAPHIEGAIKRVPAFGEVGVKKVYNGAIAYTPDGNPIVGPAWGLKNFWINEGHSFGITAAGGAGWQLAEWIINGEPTIDMLGVEPRRYGAYVTKSYLKEKNEQSLNALGSAVEGNRQELIRRLNMAPNGTPFLVSMREDLIKFLPINPELKNLDEDIRHLFKSWFNPGFLKLEKITWDTKAAVLEKIMKYEKVHKIKDMNDLKRRLQQEDRRFFAYFHPVLKDEPLIFVEVAFTKGVGNSIQEIIKPKTDEKSNYDTATFYSINNCQDGLMRVTLGNFLIKRVVFEIQQENQLNDLTSKIYYM